MIENEKDLDRKVMGLLKQKGNCYKVDTTIGYGFPDVYFVGEFACWIENKYVKNNRRVRFQPNQPEFLVSNYEVAKTFILIYYEDSKNICLYEGYTANHLRNGYRLKPYKEYKPSDFNTLFYGDLHDLCTEPS